MIEKSHFKKISLIYLLIISSFLVLSLVSLFFNQGIISLIIGVCGIFGYANLYFYVVQNKCNDSNKFLIYIFIRYLIMAVGIVVSCLIVKFTMNEYDATRYYYVCIGAIPFLAPLACLLLAKE